MDVSSYVLLGHGQALRRKLDVVANNMANVGTTGFKREQPVFHELVQPGGHGDNASIRDISFVLDRGATHDVRDGAFRATGNSLDVAVQGAGYLNVALPDGTTAYTRAGSLQLLGTGQLGTAAGLPVLGDSGAPITIPPEARAGLLIANDGTVTGPAGPIGRLAITRFENEAGLAQRGDGLWDGSGGTVLPASETRLRSGGLEASNVEPVVETTHMIEILRSYQSSQRLAEGISDMRRRAIERLGRLGN